MLDEAGVPVPLEAESVVPFAESPLDPDDESLELDPDDDGFLPRLSVLKKPDPLKVTPTGVKTFLTAMTSPVSGWANSVRVSSWKPC